MISNIPIIYTSYIVAKGIKEICFITPLTIYNALTLLQGGLKRFVLLLPLVITKLLWLILEII